MKAEIKLLVENSTESKISPTFCIKLKLQSSMVNRIPDYKQDLLSRMRDSFQEAHVEVVHIWLPEDWLCNEIVFVLRELEMDMDDVTYDVEKMEQRKDKDEYIHAITAKISKVMEQMAADNLEFCVLLPSTTIHWWIPTSSEKECNNKSVHKEMDQSNLT